MSRKCKFIDLEGSAEPQNNNKEQASYLTLSQYCQQSRPASIRTYIKTHKMPSLGLRERSAEKSRRLKVSDMCRTTIETLPLM